ncbi:hypothetical protein L210DRAFT_3653252 [Boletus edulis BED1]|uniref:Uncharacterized protein n=1 Tax=Boletus edulis BED1 TaxID=1328754 RepID=A0AAD4G7U3_BOLED|nr:hypothetical protein L210DRAFT_3653252 [Boletus edulis BED1]
MENVDEGPAAWFNVVMNGEYNIDKDPYCPPANAEPEPILSAIQVLRSVTSWAVNQYPNAGHVAGNGQTFLTCFELDYFSAYRKLNLYYPFYTLGDWQMANFLLTS